MTRRKAAFCRVHVRLVLENTSSTTAGLRSEAANFVGACGLLRPVVGDTNPLLLLLVVVVVMVMVVVVVVVVMVMLLLLLLLLVIHFSSSRVFSVCDY